MINPATPEETYEIVHEIIERKAGDRELVVVSDFDHTLCHDFEAEGDSLVPSISDDIAAAAGKLTLFVATGRRAESIAIGEMWQSGLVSESLPIITENGGARVTYDPETPHIRSYLYPFQSSKLPIMRAAITDTIANTMPDQEVVVKQAHTMLSARVLKQTGEESGAHQQLLEAVKAVNVSQYGFRVTDTRAAVSVHHQSVDKWSGFASFLRRQGIPRDRLFVIGMGDAHNDWPIFKNADLSIGFSNEATAQVSAKPSNDTVVATLEAIACSKANASHAFFEQIHSSV